MKDQRKSVKSVTVTVQWKDGTRTFETFNDPALCGEYLRGIDLTLSEYIVTDTKWNKPVYI